ncbi:hypothetical protein SVAN01_08118 [Stagonosporopsis vannaccii]|nr:hypothetical protein SVAN01_08118 [Stagonosporopsis vannaccii]
MEDRADDAAAADAYTTAKPSKFHFKSSSSRRKRRHDRSDDDRPRGHRSSKRHRSDDDPSSRSHRSSRRKHRHTPSDRHPTSTADGSYYEPSSRHRESLYDGLDDPSVDADADVDTFRESLFDALADDEGAAYWEGVYGQPINIYPTSRPGADGKLERMSEEEYAEYVRGKMWEKTHQHIVEEREARERARRERKAQRERWEEEGEREEREREGIRARMEESLRRGEERKRAKEAAASWDRYTAKWEKLSSPTTPADTTDANVADLIPWPVLSGNLKHVSKAEIERFLRAAPVWKEDAAALLKAERVRWHPDKMQRRFGQRIDEQTIRDVTAVFQVIDQLWSARR